MTRTVREIPTDPPTVHAFRIAGEVTSEDMEFMAERMNAAFDRHQRDQTMLLIFDRFEGSTFGAALNWEAIRAQFRSLGRLRKYVVVGVPESAERMIRFLGSVSSLDAQTHDIEDEAQAWQEVGARVVAG